jgi:hypothetical protein
LIGSDFYKGRQQLDFSTEEQIKINVFDWDKEFKEVFVDEGFDVVIGNPPYVFTRGDGFKDYEKNYYYNNFKHQNYQLNTFTLFIEQGYNLLAKNGKLGFIIPNNWLTIGSMKSVRDFIIGHVGDVEIINNLYKVFEQAQVDTSILLFSKKKPNFIHLVESETKQTYKSIAIVKSSDLMNEQIIQFNSFKNTEAKTIIRKVDKVSAQLSNVCIVKAGLKAYETGKGVPVQTDEMKNNRIYHSLNQISKDYRPYLDGKDVKRYALSWSGQWLKYGTNLAAPRKAALFDGERILVRQIPSKLPYAINGVIVYGNELNDINSMIIRQANDCDLRYILGIINSKLLSYWFNITFDKFQRGIFPQFKVNELEQFPIVNAGKIEQEKLVSLVDTMLKLKRQEQEAKTPQEKTIYERRIAGLDSQIDALVYKLYGLSPDEIKIVEGN